jgi:DNA-binding transcriptional LysR family regulator
MNTDQSRCFCAVVEQGSSTRAARQLFLSQPAVSQQVQALEKAYGIGLLDRSRRPLSPTEAGEVVYHYGVELLERVAAISDAVDQLKGLSADRVTIAAGLGAGRYVLPPVIAQFQRERPGVRVELAIEAAAQVFEHVLRGTVDLGITLGHAVPPDLVARPLYYDDVVLVVGRTHPWARRGDRPLPLALLAQQPLIVMPGGFRRARLWLEEQLRAAGVEPRVGLEFDTPEPIKRVVASGEGAALLFRVNVAPEVAAGWLRVVPIEGLALRGEFVTVWRPRQHLSPAVQEFVRFARAAIAEHAGLPPLGHLEQSSFPPRRSGQREEGADGTTQASQTHPG